MYIYFGDENLSKKVKYLLQNFDLSFKKYAYVPKRIIRDMHSKMHTFDMQYGYQNAHFRYVFQNAHFRYVFQNAVAHCHIQLPLLDCIKVMTRRSAVTGKKNNGITSVFIIV